MVVVFIFPNTTRDAVASKDCDEEAVVSSHKLFIVKKLLFSESLFYL